MIKCKKCGCNMVLKYTSRVNNKLEKFVECPKCGHQQQSTTKKKGSVVLK